MKSFLSYPWPIAAIYPEKDEFLAPFLKEIYRARLISRLWEKDWTIWKPSADDITNRLGWLEAPEKMTSLTSEITDFGQEVIKKGFKKALLLGIGGSSLAAEVLAQVFRSVSSGVALHFLDSTVPAAVKKMADLCPPAKTLYLISSKSGTTTETLAFFHYFWARLSAKIGPEPAGSYFVAITDPGTPLQVLAERANFRRVWLSDPEVGGRFSAISPFGLIPASLMGINIPELLASARKMTVMCREEMPENNPGAWLVAFLATAMDQDRDKLLLWVEPGLTNLADWLEQLIAESTGKEKRGLVPVVGQEELLDLIHLPDVCLIGIGSSDFISEITKGKTRWSRVPAIFLSFDHRAEIGAMFFLWEWAIALASSFLKINPFDQPDVEKTKVRTREILVKIKAAGSLPPLSNGIAAKNIELFGFPPSTTMSSALSLSMEEARNASYLALLAFLAPEKGIRARLTELRKALIKGLGRPVTIGWGPRYLHSTGQLHKGDRGLGVFWQLVAEDDDDLIIPDFPPGEGNWLTFGQLKEAQARADYETIHSLNRKVIRFNLGEDIISGLAELKELLASWLKS